MTRRTALASFAGAVAGAVALPAPPVSAAKPTAAGLNMVSLQIAGVTLQNGQLVAQALIGTTAFPLPSTLTPGATTGGVSILNLQLAPVNLNL